MAAADRFSMSMWTVTRVPGATRMSERRRWMAIRWCPQRTKMAAIAGNAASPSAIDLEARGTDDPRRQPHGEAGEQDGHPAAGRHQGVSATGTGTSERISSRMTCGERPLMTASAVTMIRCASDGTASAFTSSGMT